MWPDRWACGPVGGDGGAASPPHAAFHSELRPGVGRGFSIANPEETKTKLDVNPWVFWGANAIIGLMVFAAAIATQDVRETFSAIQEGVVQQF